MRRLYSGILATIIGALCSMPVDMIAQKGPSEGTSGKVRTKIVRDCEYEVLPGLAEITSIEKIRPASESALKYDEHEVLFKFTPMEGGEILEMLRDTEIEFVLRSRAIRVPVGPEYIKAKNLKVGTKYAMNLLQTRNRDACLELYTYESKALDNDLFEAYEHIIDYTKEAYVQQLEAKERAYERNKANEKDVVVAETVDPTVETVVETPIQEDEFDYGGLSEEEIANLSEAEMRALVEKNLRKKFEDEGTPSSYDGGSSGIDEAKLRAEIEAKKREEYAAQLAAAENGKANSSTTTIKSNNSNKSSNAASDAIREAKRKAKEAEKAARLEEKRKEQEALERARKKEELRQKLEKEVEAEIQREIEEKAEAARLAAIQEAKKEEEERNKKTAAIEKIKEIEREMAQRIVDETKRKDCVFGDRISGTIEVIKVSKVKEANLSHLKYTEYEVMVTFRPDNYADLSKKEKKDWEAAFVFTLDPMGQNANPGAGYIRKYKVFKASKYQGFAQPLQSGICTEMMLYSPDLPNDGAKIKLK
ncbi:MULTISPECIES: hypothetical protein [unclassified Aureispira]|uniref:hypothetical protein n=1 Tax=unclassified Aureispira TaxID=2649989 RepID=UPI0006987151|nr:MULTISPECIES: hypothetical protein [unclassified Aureispira]WMX16856.1 hypothetical protein QP953_10785 [Aureispira sp. CCB-E]